MRTAGKIVQLLVAHLGGGKYNINPNQIRNSDSLDDNELLVGHRL